jgi:cell division protein FtsQ
MSETRIRRGGSTRLATRSSSTTRPRAGRAAPRKSTGLSRFLAALPISEAGLQRLATWLVIIVASLGLWAIARFFGLPGMARDELANAAGRAGFQVSRVEVHGTEHMDDVEVYAIALGVKERSMLNVDLPKLRTEMLKLNWVKDARISRRLPDTLVVDIVERKPVAVWQHEGHLALIDVSGAVLDQVKPDEMPDLPLVVGPQANLQTARLTALMDAAPALKSVLAGATWVGNRRWDLRFQSGETLSLPEGAEEAAAALVSFTRMDGVNRLLGRGIVRFDMRDPDKFVLRLPKTEVKEEGQNASDSKDGDKATAITNADVGAA